MKLRLLSNIFVCAGVAVLFANKALGAEQCGIMTPYGPGCRVYVMNYQSAIKVRKQRSPVTCWAASLSNLLTYYHKNVTEVEIVSEITGQPIIASPQVMNDAVNHDYQDIHNDTVSVSAVGTTDNFWHTSHDLSNSDLYDALRDNTPILYADLNHAMILVDAVFVQSPTGPTPIYGVVADPSPAAPNFRPLQLPEMFGMFAAIVSVD